MITLFDGYETNGVSLLDLHHSRPLQGRCLPPGMRSTFIGSQGDELLFLTTGRSARRVIAVNVRQPSGLRPSSCRSGIAALRGRTLCRRPGHRALVGDAHSVVRLFERNGRPVGEVPLPGQGTVDGFQAGHGQRDVLLVCGLSDADSRLSLRRRRERRSCGAQPKMAASTPTPT